jgi:transposase
MPMVSEMRHPSGFTFAQERKIVHLRDAARPDGSRLEWADIAKRVRDLRGQVPRPRHVANTYRKATRGQGSLKYKYKKCGRKPVKMSRPVQRFLVKKLLALRCKTACTSTVLQQHLAKEMGVHVSAPYIRKFLAKKGYQWLPRRQKRKYSAVQRKARLAFANKVLRMSAAGLKTAMSFAMDGVVLPMPPAGAEDRMNFCLNGEEHMWRKATEGFSPKLAGGEDYGNQVPLARAVPMWAGCSAGGFSIITFHPRRKLCGAEWARIVEKGDLVKAIKAANPDRHAGPWSVLCDNESFLRAGPANAAHKAAGVKLWKIPPKSPDLNPVERCWSWLRRKLRLMDLADAVAKRSVLGKTSYKARVRRVIRSAKGQSIGVAQARLMKRVCREVVKKKGAATGY